MYYRAETKLQNLLSYVSFKHAQIIGDYSMLLT